jgi:hypothetical protein
VKFRLNYGNGQVSQSFTSRKDVDTEARVQAEYSRRIGQTPGPLIVQIYDHDTQEWRTIP